MVGRVLRDPGALSQKAGLELKRFRAAKGPAVEHAPDRLSRVRSTEDDHYLIQVMGRGEALHRWAVRVGGTPGRDRVTDVSAAESRPSLTWRAHARGRDQRRYLHGVPKYPTVTPWVRVVTAVGPARRDGAGWRATRRPLDEQTRVIAVGARPVWEKDAWVTREVRVQRFFLRRAMAQQVSVTLLPADADGVFRRLRVSRGGVVAHLNLEGAYGDILSFDADQDALRVISASGRAHVFHLDVKDGRLSLLPNPGAHAAGEEEVRAWTNVVGASEVARDQPADCGPKLIRTQTK